MRKPTIKQKVLEYVAHHPGCSLAEVCERVAPTQQRRAETAVAILWSTGKMKVENNILHDISPKPC